ncbi:carboxypeptidase-like regulatory domain-containing protein [Sediminibacterium soli]|uniref:carboxypeptidase-like regulatory domain-containing protein n=1 Tax=Sediminibacterium soli TaxID=2698829 RepID=UPI001379A06F|nr:carboxypeptidase-like regulatory domain-containing protein [Sediminibacterium soli]NCI47680.1 carboxypeptidase-like regulatory domain-containing protein [Sediminibacterium soli]
MGCLLLLGISAYAQHGSVSGRITDSTGKNPLALGTVSIFKAKDTVLVTYRLSNDKGEFSIGTLPANIPLRLLVSFAGYEPWRKEFTLAKNGVLNLGNIKMVSSALQLDEVIVIAERPPIVVRKDTVEFNAASFKTLPNAVVEDLLKKLPGV